MRAHVRLCRTTDISFFLSVQHWQRVTSAEMAHDERLDPDTAPKDRSVWKCINRTALERQTKALSTKQHVAGRRFYAEPSCLKDKHPYPLPFELEKSLADDFAFIAAFQPQVESVSATAIEQSENEPLFRVKLAANEGISPGVKRKFDDLFEALRKHAKKGDSSILRLTIT